jgi:hypothetical protein
LDLAIGYDEAFQQGQFHHKRRKLFTETYLCMFNTEKTGIAPPISLDSPAHDQFCRTCRTELSCTDAP